MTDKAQQRPSMMEKQASVTMEYFLETTNLDADTAALLRKYDKDGNGSFSKDEVVAIIMDLRETIKTNENLGQYNKLFKRLLTAAVFFCILLLASMFGLSYAVAALTAKTEVDSSGSLVATGSHSIVSTNSRAEIHVVDETEGGKFCVTRDEIDIMTLEIAAGRNVMLGMNSMDGGEAVTQVSGAGFDIVDESTVCFNPPDGTASRLCWTEGGCDELNSSGRRLSADERENLGLRPHRRLGVPFGIIQESTVGDPTPAPTPVPTPLPTPAPVEEEVGATTPAPEDDRRF